VPKPAQKIAKSSAEEARTELVSRITAQAPSAGEHSTAINGLVLFRRTQATACYRAAVEPSLTVFVQGKKRMTLGGTEYLCGPSSFFLSSIDVPVESQILEASEEVPLLSMLLRLDMSIVREILNREKLAEAETSSQRRGVAIGQAPAGLLNVCSRLMEFLDTPEDIPFLSHLIQREIMGRVWGCKFPLATGGVLAQSLESKQTVQMKLSSAILSSSILCLPGTTFRAQTHI